MSESLVYAGRMDVEFWLWWITDERTGKQRKTRWRMTAESASRYVGAKRVDGSCEVRSTPGPDEEMTNLGVAKRLVPGDSSMK